jgi:3-phosphoshikimate 1-carboxyvinyltransferase
VQEEPYQATRYRIESDWSAASYWYSMAVLAEEADIFLLGLRKDSLQGDAAIAELMQPFGVQTEYHEDGVQLRKVPVAEVSEVAWNYADTPDLAQTVAVVSAATGIPVRMWGLESLRIKETDRIQALQTELAKFGLRMAEDKPGYFSVKGQFVPATEAIETYEDHRMAMAFAPLALRQPGLQINDPEVVEKSYPEFWDHLKEAGIRIEKV